MTAALAARRAANERGMTDRCTVTRGGGRPAFNKETGTTHTAPPPSVYSGRCRIAPGDGGRRDDVAGEQVTVVAYTARIPVGTAVEVDDRFTLTESTKEGLVDHPLRVVAVAHTTLGVRLDLANDIT